MHDFAALVRERLRLCGANLTRDREIQEELTAHLEDVYADANRVAAITERNLHRAHRPPLFCIRLTDSLENAIRNYEYGGETSVQR